ncbi:MAG: riboflavin kinase / adenylyltransferase [Clostridiales bacterium]|jgi:riboflavin kinase/FMN adenylyltransferase|nr:riboflavin kinase / adenylyltransferase [Clostridiales bacterium]
MKIFFDIEEIEPIEVGTSVALGTFDGLHIGHIEVLNRMKRVAEDKGLKSFVYTFSNHPRELLSPDNVPPKIMDVEEKVQIFTRLDFDYLALVKFDMAQLSIEPEDFIEKILVGLLNMKHLTVGYDFHFGLKGRGNVEMLKSFAEQYGYTYEIVKPIMKNDIRVSSTLIRELLIEGKIEEANYYLGRRHFVKGVVVRSKGLGRTINFATANLRIKENISTIKSGVYITETILRGQKYRSVTNVGTNPTFNQKGIHLETHIVGIDRDLYDEVIEVNFIKRLRDEMKFESVDALVEAMQNDYRNMMAYFDAE